MKKHSIVLSLLVSMSSYGYANTDTPAKKQLAPVAEKKAPAEIENKIEDKDVSNFLAVSKKHIKNISKSNVNYEEYLQMVLRSNDVSWQSTSYPLLLEATIDIGNLKDSNVSQSKELKGYKIGGGYNMGSYAFMIHYIEKNTKYNPADDLTKISYNSGSSLYSPTGYVGVKDRSRTDYSSGIKAEINKPFSWNMHRIKPFSSFQYMESKSRETNTKLQLESFSENSVMQEIIKTKQDNALVIDSSATTVKIELGSIYETYILDTLKSITTLSYAVQNGNNLTTEDTQKSKFLIINQNFQYIAPGRNSIFLKVTYEKENREEKDFSTEKIEEKEVISTGIELGFIF